MLGIELLESDFEDIHPLGKNNNCPIKLELKSYLKKKEILKNCHKLKGTKVAVANDLTHEQRKENKILVKHLKIARQRGGYESCYIRAGKLFIDGVSYLAKDLESVENTTAGSIRVPFNQGVGNREKEKDKTRDNSSNSKIQSVKVVQESGVMRGEPRTRSGSKGQRANK